MCIRDSTDICPKENITLPDMLSRIYDATGRKFIVIIDEWDVLIRDEANNQRVQEEYIKFLRGMFKGCLLYTSTESLSLRM